MLTFDIPFVGMVGYVRKCLNGREYLEWLNDDHMDMLSIKAEIKAICEMAYIYGPEKVRVQSHIGSGPDAFIEINGVEIPLEVSSKVYLPFDNHDTSSCLNSFKNQYKKIAPLLKDGHNLVISIKGNKYRANHADYLEIRNDLQIGRDCDLIVQRTPFGGFIYCRSDLVNSVSFDFEPTITLVVDSRGGVISSSKNLPLSSKLIKRSSEKRKQHKELASEEKITYIFIDSPPDSLREDDLSELKRKVGEHELIIISAFGSKKGHYFHKVVIIKGEMAIPIPPIENPFLIKL